MTAAGLHELLVGEPLTAREFQALHGAALGESARATGDRLFLAADTVRHHRKTACAKLGAHNTTRAVVVAIALGMLNLDRLVPLDMP
jgi:DNA-binding CsgD family transcriptional regulator